MKRVIWETISHSHKSVCMHIHLQPMVSLRIPIHQMKQLKMLEIQVLKGKRRVHVISTKGMLSKLLLSTINGY